MNNKTIELFITDVMDFYRSSGRHTMPWRLNTDPYWIAVSEIMLQQTQAERVEPKFLSFVKSFPDWNSLAKADFSKVLIEWQGLGYNRRALYLQQAAKTIVTQYNSILPSSRDELQILSGIGEGTSGSIMASAFNQPVVFIETNIRRVFIHNFFNSKTKISDSEIIPVLQQCIHEITKQNITPREWYWALMDYGTNLKKTIVNPNRKSQHYYKQSKFEGSLRQLRGEILRQLSESPKNFEQLDKDIEHPQKNHLESLLLDLQKEGFIEKTRKTYRIREK